MEADYLTNGGGAPTLSFARVHSMPKPSVQLPALAVAADLPADDRDACAIAELTADPAVGTLRAIRSPATGERLWLVEVRPGSVLEDVRCTRRRRPRPHPPR